MLEPYEKALDLLEKFGSEKLAKAAVGEISDHVCGTKVESNEDPEYDFTYWAAVRECIITITSGQPVKLSKENIDFVMSTRKIKHFYEKWLEMSKSVSYL